ncbi:hypothetical protein TMatcc_010758 [Talaromyces marneffei ATCC 18224]
MKFVSSLVVLSLSAQALASPYVDHHATKDQRDINVFKQVLNKIGNAFSHTSIPQATKVKRETTKVQRDIRIYQSYLSKLDQGVQQLNTDINNYQGGDAGVLITDIDTILTTTNEASFYVGTQSPLMPREVFQLVSLVQQFKTHILATAQAFISKKDPLIASGFGPRIVAILKKQQDATKTLGAAMYTKVPSQYADLPRQFASEIVQAIQKVIDALSPATTPTSASSSTASTTTPTPSPYPSPSTPSSLSTVSITTPTSSPHPSPSSPSTASTTTPTPSSPPSPSFPSSPSSLSTTSTTTNTPFPPPSPPSPSSSSTASITTDTLSPPPSPPSSSSPSSPSTVSITTDTLSPESPPPSPPSPSYLSSLPASTSEDTLVPATSSAPATSVGPDSSMVWPTSTAGGAMDSSTSPTVPFFTGAASANQVSGAVGLAAGLLAVLAF